jgi:molecular chaperone GrpE
MSDEEEIKKDPAETEIPGVAGTENESDNSEVLEMEFNEDGEEDLKKTLKKLREDLKQCRKEKEEFLTGWQKERAEFVNYRKQEDDRKTMFSESMRERILTRFLAVMDSFNMAFANKESWEKVDENWRKGVEYIYSQMNTIFEEYGVKPIGEIEETFDPNIHQSIELVQTDKNELDHKVSEVIQKGYKLGDRVIRPARVNVYEYKEEPAQ